MAISLKEQRLNEVQIMNNGQKATIIAYRSSCDIDVEFEDGTIECHKKYKDFKNGRISNAKLIPNSRLGMVKKMNNGQFAKVIAYRKYKDIDVEFEDGTIVKNRHFYNFSKGNLRNLNHIRPYNSIKSDFYNCLGEAKIMNNGQTAKIIRLKNYDFIDVEFEDGTIIENKRYSNFKKGSIRNPNYNSKTLEKERVGTSSVMNNGQKATIVLYKNCNDITIKFEDGTVISHTKYSLFIRGNIGNPSDISKKNFEEERVGEKRVMNCGMEAEIIAYRNNNSIDVRFSNGEMVLNKSYQNFRRGLIKLPKSFEVKRIGEKRVMNCGMEAEIIAYRNYEDIDVRFEDGTIVYNKSCRNFSQGKIRNPYVKSHSLKETGASKEVMSLL